MVAVIVILTLATVAVSALLLAPRIAEPHLVYDEAPDQPRAFGYGMAWLAIRTRDTDRVIDRLGLTAVTTANWDNGLGTVYSDSHAESHVYVSQPVNGWSFVVGLALPQPMGKAFVDKCIPLLLDLGSEFIEVQYYLAYPAFDYFAWARVIDGKLVRAYAMNDEGVVWNKGKPTKEEKKLGIRLYEIRGVKRRRGEDAGDLVLYPTEGHVLQLAGKWSIDPSRLEGMAANPRLGLLAEAPVRWRPERLRRTG